VQGLAEGLQLVEIMVDDEGAEADHILVAETGPLQCRPQPVEGQVHLGCEVTRQRSAGGVGGVLAGDEDEFAGCRDGVAVAEGRRVVEGGRVGDRALIGRHVCCNNPY